MYLPKFRNLRILVEEKKSKKVTRQNKVTSDCPHILKRQRETKAKQEYINASVNVLGTVFRTAEITSKNSFRFAQVKQNNLVPKWKTTLRSNSPNKLVYLFLLEIFTIIGARVKNFATPVAGKNRQDRTYPLYRYRISVSTS